jgi:hypothetical protein
MGNIRDKKIIRVVPSKMEKRQKRRAENKSKYGRRIKQLQLIVEDKSYIPVGSTDSYHEFIRSMYIALVDGRKITPKMRSAITKIVEVYAKHINPKYKKDKIDYVEESLAKIGMVKRLLKEGKYTDIYTERSMYFLKSVEQYLKKTHKLSVKQRKALNSMYKRFEKRVNKGIK